MSVFKYDKNNHCGYYSVQIAKALLVKEEKMTYWLNFNHTITQSTWKGKTMTRITQSTSLTSNSDHSSHFFSHQEHICV